MQRIKYGRDTYSFFRTYSTRWGDMDGLRHLNHAVYLTLIESARVDFYEYIGIPISSWGSGISAILASMKVDYFNQVYHPAELEIGQRIIRVGNTSFDILTGLFVKGGNEPVVQSVFTMVSFDYADNRPVPNPEKIRKYLRPL